ncbi:MAG TPA: hypothetical protein VHS74_01290 [Solirubrobacterales bacterium]|jgi:hypothetical protein|nr:hypothetical protein [Solirubrobacterales bacterium]
MPFETFKRQRAIQTTEPAVTIQKRGTFSLNSPAFEALGNPEYLELLYDRQERLIGLRKADSSVPHAYLVRPLGKGGTTQMVSGTAFLAYYGIEFDTARRWIAQLQDDVLVIDLKEPGVEVTGSRTKSAAAGGT